MEPTLKYTDEADKCYGLTGMVIGLFIYDGEQYLSSVSLDSDNGSSIEFTPEFYFSGNPRLSPKSVWDHLLKQYEMSVGMTVSNVVCRCLVHRGCQIDYALRRALHDAVAVEGRETCSLEDDEIDAIFNKCYGYMNRVFAHRSVQPIVRDFAARLTDRRSLARDEMTDFLRALQSL